MQKSDAPLMLKEQPPAFMAMRYLNLDVVEAAKRRLRYVFKTYEYVSVSFSGGKDSLVLLTLAEEIHKELGLPGKLNVKFMDEELVPDSVINFVQLIADSGRFNFKWYCLNMYVGFFVMGKHQPFITWDKSRKWHRTPPDKPYVIYDVGVDTSSKNENEIGKLLYPPNGKTHVELVGVRADESLVRFLSVSHKMEDTPTYTGAVVPNHLWVSKPMYDFTELDIFKFLKDRSVPYCECYNTQLWAGAPLRVASAMHERAFTQFVKLKAIAPKFYEQLRALYPEIETHYRYMLESRGGSESNSLEYPPTFDGLRQFVLDTIDVSHQKEALAYVKGCETARRMALLKNQFNVLGAISIRRVFSAISAGKFAKGKIPRHIITQEDLAFEKIDNS